MATNKTCLRCGGDNLEPGTLLSPTRAYFQPENAKFLTLQSSDVSIRANICLDCGFIEMVGDVHKAQRLTGKAKPA
jgi:hypothetical protein